jgi:putative AdoMet-dependent methyltransferase
MKTRPDWQYDEMKHCSVDFSDVAQVRIYDKRHQRFRDYKKESEAIIEMLELGGDSTVIDIGCGTGAFTLHAAKICKKIYAVDVSKPMLDYTRQKAQKEGLKNIEFYHSGFLTYMHCAEPVDAVVSAVAMHHLPDFWKLIALRRIYDMLKLSGKFFLTDVVFSFDVCNYENCLNEWVKSMAKNVDEDFKVAVETHIRDEYSTFDWVIEGLLEKTRFRIESKDRKDGFMATYLCVKRN